MSQSTIDVLVIGGGIVGLSTAYHLLQSKPGIKLTLMEKESDVAGHQTGNNSGVIHSGIYYKPGSLKAINCINGYSMLLAYARQKAIPYELCGKLIVAGKETELAQLNMIFKRGKENGLEHIRFVDKMEMREIEPHVEGLRGIHVPYTGIIDYKLVAKSLLEDILRLGAEVILGEQAKRIRKQAGTLVVESIKRSINTKYLINCAGLHSDSVAKMELGSIDVRIIPFRGEYYELKPDKRYLVKSLIYPVPDPHFPFLGVHFTKMINGGVEAGPNAVFAFKREGYKKSDWSWYDTLSTLAWPGFRKVALKYWKTGLAEIKRSYSKAAFTQALQTLVPDIRQEDLIPAPAGVRAQACDRNGGLLDDFCIRETESSVHVLNAPSPAATSALSIGKTVAELLMKRWP